MPLGLEPGTSFDGNSPLAMVFLLKESACKGETFMQKIFAIIMAAVMVFTTACAERSTACVS